VVKSRKVIEFEIRMLKGFGHTRKWWDRETL